MHGGVLILEKPGWFDASLADRMLAQLWTRSHSTMNFERASALEGKYGRSAILRDVSSLRLDPRLERASRP